MPIIWEIIKVIAIVCSLGGAYLIASLNKKTRLLGFLIWIISNTIWLINSFMYLDYTQAYLWIGYMCVTLKGVYSNH